MNFISITMRKYWQSSLTLWVIVTLLLSREAQTKSSIKCKKHERQTLLDFKHSFTRDPMNRLSSWVGDDCCQWRGVTCDNLTDNVVKLILHSYPYDGHGVTSMACISKGDHSLSSNGLSSALLELNYLTHLDLSWNDFNGSRIPEFLGSMTRLRYLDLSEAGFTGIIPPQLGNLTNLRYLNLSSSCDYQELFSESLGWTSRLSKLQSLDMGSCDLSQAQDALQVLSSLPSLLTLRLSDAGLRNSHLFDTFDKTIVFPAIEQFDLSSNSLEGPFPYILKKTVSTLKSLSLSSNIFNGSVPIWVRNFTRIEILDLGFNLFSHIEGGIWSIMSDSCNLKYFSLSENKITGEIFKPSSNSSQCLDLEHLDLSGNALNGSLPSRLTELRNLNHLDLSSNRFQGQIPSNLTQLSFLRFLDLSKNLLSGSTPTHLGRLTEIEHLGISSNTLQGTVLDIANLSNLAYLDVDCNNFDLSPNFTWQPRFQLQTLRILPPCDELNTVVFPQWLRTQNRIEKLDLSDCGLSGKLPKWVGNMTNLLPLFLSNNDFTSSLPHNFSVTLGYLDLSNNFLTGSLPRRSISPELYYLDLHNNMLSGSIPHWLGRLEMLYYLDLSSNQLSGTITEGTNASSLLTNSNSFLMILDLSYNQLSGEMYFPNVSSQTYITSLNLRGNDLTGVVPSELCSFSSLIFMDLAENHFTGQIPPCFSSIFTRTSTGGIKLPTLEVTEIIKRQSEVFAGSSWLASNLDLSNNRLVGAIPEAITNISTLVGLNLSYNHLTGNIPKNILKIRLKIVDRL